MAFRIGTTEYATLVDAITDAQAGNTIVFLDDQLYGNFTGNAVTIPAGKNLTLDLNGHTMSGTATNAGASSLLRIAPGANVTIADSVGTGKMSYTGVGDPSYSYGTYTVLNEGQLVVKGGTIENLTNGGASYAIEVHDNASSTPVTLDIQGGVIDCPNGDQGVRMYSNDPNNNGSNYVRMTGGTVNNGIWMDDQLVSTGNSSDMELGIFGGEVNGLLDLTNPDGKATVNITGGDLNIDIRVRENKPAGTADDPKQFINITGGNVDIGTLDNQSTTPIEDTVIVKGGNLSAASVAELQTCFDEEMNIEVNPDGSVSFLPTDHKWMSKRNLKYSWKRIKERLEIISGDAVRIDSEGTLLAGGHRLDVLFDSETIVLNSEGELSVPIDNVTIVINSEGKLAATGVEAGVAIELVDSEGAGVNTINVLFDSETGIDVDSENRLYLRIDNETIRVNSEGLLEADSLPKPLLPETFLHVNSEGDVEWRPSKINGVELVDDKNTEDVKIIWWGSEDAYAAIESEGVYDYTLYIVNNGERTVHTSNYLDLDNKPSINGMILTGDKLPSDLDIYTIPEIDNMLAAGRTIIVTETKPADPLPNTIYYVGTTTPYRVWLYDYQKGEHDLGTSDLLGYTVDSSLILSPSRQISHSNVYPAGTVGDSTHIPRLVVDAQGHLTSATDEVEAYPPLTEGAQFQYWRSKGSGTGEWATLDKEITELSTHEVPVTPRAVFEYIPMVSGAPTWSQTGATMALGSFTRVGQMLTFTLIVNLTSAIAAGTTNAKMGAIAFDTNIVDSCAVYGSIYGTTPTTGGSAITGWFDGGNIYISTNATLASGTRLVISGTGIARKI